MASRTVKNKMTDSQIEFMMLNPNLSKPSAQTNSIVSKNYMNRCDCGSGEYAIFGFNVSLRNGRIGEWKCKICKPK